VAKLPAVLKMFSQLDGREVSAIENVSRELRKAGLLTQGKRGVGAPDMQVSDFTNLLFSYASRRSNETAKCVERLRYGLLMSDEAAVSSFEFADRARKQDEDGLLRAGPFIDSMLEAMVDGGENAFLERRRDFHADDSDRVQHFLVDIEVHDAVSGLGAVVIHISDESDEYGDKILFSYHENDNPSLVIQNAAIINGEIVWSIADFIKGGDNEK